MPATTTVPKTTLTHYALRITHYALRHYHLHTHRLIHFRDVPSLVQLASFLIDTERHDVVVVLIGGEEELTGRVDAEISGMIALGGLVADESDFAGVCVHGIDHDAVVAAVRSVKEAAVC